MESLLIGSPKSPIVKPVARPTANFPPSLWGDTFLSYLPNQSVNTLCQWKEKAEALKREVLEMIREDHGLPDKRSSAKLDLIDAMQRLGVAYHFNEEIEEELERMFTEFRDQTRSKDDDLHTVALRFRLLREHGYNLSCDVFRKFLDDKSNFHKSLCDDVDGLLSLYEASHLRVQGDAILDDALRFTTSCLKSLLPKLSLVLSKQVRDALYRPLRKRLSRLEARNYISVYEQIEHHSEVLLHFAKLDFNILQKSHQEELSFLSKWWKDLDCGTKFPFVRNRLVEGYFWILGVYFEPQYAMARRFLTQVIATTSIIDDIYDAYGTIEELELFTDATERWDVAAIVDLPEYMKPCYQQLLDVFGKAEEEKLEQNMPLCGVQCAKEAMKRLIKAYLVERKWLETLYVPKYDEYMEVALVSSGYMLLSISSLVWMGDCANDEAFTWLLDQPKILAASSLICRLMDDIVSHKFEQEREHPPSAIECYTKQFGVSEGKACDTLRVKVKEGWKDMNEAFLRPTPVEIPVLMRVLNLTRVVELLHKESDGYTHVTQEVKEYIISLLCTVVQV